MRIEVNRVEPERIAPLRQRHRDLMRCQIVHDSLPARGLSHCWSIVTDGWEVGYGCVVGFGDDPKDTVDELYLVPEARGRAGTLFAALVEATGARSVQAQTNDPLLLLMLFDHCVDLVRDRILFEDGFTSDLRCPGARFRRIAPDDLGRRVGERKLEDPEEWIVEVDGEVVGVGGVLFHYNPPFGDLYMEVAPAHRRRGYGSFLVQELKAACRALGKTPAARCNAGNTASRATLEKAGMVPCGGIVQGTIAPERLAREVGSAD